MPDFNIDKFQNALLYFLVKYNSFTEEEAEEITDHLWLAVDFEDLTSQHPFFLAAFVAGEELFVTNQKYLALRREIDLIWL